MPDGFYSEDPIQEKNSGLQNENKAKPTNHTVVINTLYDKGKINQIDLEDRINKINNKINSILKDCVPTNPSTLETELGSYFY